MQGLVAPSVNPPDCHFPASGEELVQAAQQLGKVALARLMGRGLEGAAQRGGNAGLRRRNVHTDDLVLHPVHIRGCNVLVLQLHWTFKRPNLQLVALIS